MGSGGGGIVVIHAARVVVAGILAGIALDLTIAYIYLGCMDREWP